MSWVIQYYASVCLHIKAALLLFQYRSRILPSHCPICTSSQAPTLPSPARCTETLRRLSIGCWPASHSILVTLVSRSELDRLPLHLWWNWSHAVISTVSSYSQISKYITPDGDVVSHVNITDLEISNGGRYTCYAKNSVGIGKETTTLHIYGIEYPRVCNMLRWIRATRFTCNCI